MHYYDIRVTYNDYVLTLSVSVNSATAMQFSCCLCLCVLSAGTYVRLCILSDKTRNIYTVAVYVLQR
jgi:hypothetical protein